MTSCTGVLKYILCPQKVTGRVWLAQWLSWLTPGRCNPKVPSSFPAGGKDFPCKKV